MDFLRHLLVLTKGLKLEGGAKLSHYLIRLDVQENDAGNQEWKDTTIGNYHQYSSSDSVGATEAVSKEVEINQDREGGIALDNKPQSPSPSITEHQPSGLFGPTSAVERRVQVPVRHIEPSTISTVSIGAPIIAHSNNIVTEPKVHVESAPLKALHISKPVSPISPTTETLQQKHIVAVTLPAALTVYFVEIFALVVFFTFVFFLIRRLQSRRHQDDGHPAGESLGKGDKSDDSSSSGVSTSTPYSQRGLGIIYPGLGSALSDNTNYMIPMMSPIELPDQQHRRCTFSATPSGLSDSHAKPKCTFASTPSGASGDAHSKPKRLHYALSEERPRSSTWLDFTPDSKRALYSISRSSSTPEHLFTHAATATSADIETAIGKIDPNIYRQEKLVASVVSKWRQKSKKHETGKLSFKLSYDAELELLTVHIINVTNLPVVLKEGTGDIFVKLSLEPDHKRRSMSSTIQRGSRSPDIQQNFAFRIVRCALYGMTVMFTVCEYDSFSHTQSIGKATYELSGHDFGITPSGEKGSEKVISLELEKPEKENEGADKGELMISLTYLPNAERVNLIIMKAQNLRLPEWGDKEVGRAILNTFVKITIMRCGKVMKHKNTKVVRRSCSPIFNEAFSIDRMRLSDMPECCFVLSMCVRLNHFRSHRVIGRCVVGGKDCAVGDGLAHWTDMSDSPRSIVARWHKIRD